MRWLGRTLAPGRQIGFVVEQPRGAYRLFRYRTPEVLLVLPPGREEDTVDAAHLLAVRRHVLENGLLEEAAFDALLQAVHSTVASRCSRYWEATVDFVFLVRH